MGLYLFAFSLCGGLNSACMCVGLNTVAGKLIKRAPCEGLLNQIMD